MATGLGSDQSAGALARSGGDLPLALVHAVSRRPVGHCRRALGEGGTVRAAIALLAGDDAR
jgi:hypothetical protein